MSSYAKNLAAQTTTKNTSQLNVIPGREVEMAPNNGGGVSFLVDEWTYLDRFLILGTETSTYYQSAPDLTKQNVDNVRKLIAKDGKRVVDRVVEVSDKGLASKNDPALLVLAMCASADSLETRKYALDNLKKVARIGTHLFKFAEFVNGMRGWGRALTRAIADWYNSKNANQLAYQVIKYQQREGWSNRDLLRLSHPVASNDEQNSIYKWIVSGDTCSNAIISAFESAKVAKSASEVISLVQEYNLPREAIPTQFLNDAAVWDALLQKMPMTAMIRNLGKMSSLGMFGKFSDAEKLVVGNLSNQKAIQDARVHPLAILNAMMTYKMGRGVKGSLSWEVSRKVVDALNDAFYLSFKNVTPTGKNTLLALDVSGSMTWENIGGVVGLTPRAASAAMALVTANVESNYEIMGFSGSWSKSDMKDIKITPKMNLDEAMSVVNKCPAGGTDCALPMLWAERNKVAVDNFAIYTDNDTNSNSVHPSLALKNYCNKQGRNAKLAVVAMTATNFTIADPKMNNMMDFCGFSSDAPQVMNNFFSS